MRDQHMWGKKPIVYGAGTKTDGFVRILGVHVWWNDRGNDEWQKISIECWKLFCLERGYEGTRWATAALPVTFRPANWNIGNREKAKARRLARKRHAIRLASWRES